MNVVHIYLLADGDTGQRDASEEALVRASLQNDVFLYCLMASTPEFVSIPGPSVDRDHCFCAEL